MAQSALVVLGPASHQLRLSMSLLNRPTRRHLIQRRRTTKPISTTKRQLHTLPTASPFPQRSSGESLKCLPKASRDLAGKKFAAILDAVISRNDHASWNCLLRFSSRCLRHPGRRRRRWSLATAVKTQLRDETDPPTTTRPHPKRKESDLGKLLADCMSESLRRATSRVQFVLLVLTIRWLL